MNNITEHGEAIALFDYVLVNERRIPELRLFHAIPNGAKLSWSKNNDGIRYSKESQRLKNEGLRSGVPDYFLPVPRSGYYGLYIELKANLYMPSPEQIIFLIYARSLGYRSTCCWSTDSAIKILNSYLDGLDLVKNRIFYNVPERRREPLQDLINSAMREADLPAEIYNPNVTLID